MTEYIRWSWFQLFLLIFQPTRFRQEVEDERNSTWTVRQRLEYLVKLLPWIVLLAVLANLAVGVLRKDLGLAFEWGNSWLGVAVGVALGVVYGVAGGVAGGVGGGVVGGVALGFAFGVDFGVTGGVAVGAAGGIAVSLGGTRGVARSVVGGITFGVAIGGTGSLAAGVAGGLATNVVPGGVPVAIAVFIAVTIAVAIAIAISGDVAGDIARGVAQSIAVGFAIGVLFGVSRDKAPVMERALAFGVAFPVTFWVAYYRLLDYPLEVAMAYLAERYARRGPDAARRAFGLCPVSWNEVIWLPLPFVHPLLVRLLQIDREDGLRKIKFIASERPLQRKATLGALADLAIDDLSATSIEELAEVTRRLGWIAESPLDLPQELVTILPLFDRLAQHAVQSLSVPSAYRKREALKRALEELDGLERLLVATPGRYAPPLLTKARAWRGLIEERAALLAAEAEATRELPNPFIFGSPLHEQNSGVFAGRRDIVQAIERVILGSAQAPTLLLHGPRRMGKTSILKQLPRLLGPDFAPAEVDCQLPSFRESSATALHTLSEAISDALRRRHVRIDAIDLDLLKKEPFAVFSDWLNVIERAMPPTLRVLVCLDEIEKLGGTAERGWGADLLDLLRHIAQHHPRVVLLFCGAHTFAELGPVWTDRFLGVRRVRVTYLTPEDVRPLLTPEIPGFDLAWSPEAIDALVTATNGQPFLTQAVAFELVQHLNEHKSRRAELRDVEAAIERALESGAEYFAYLWSAAGPEGQVVLTAAAFDQPLPDSPIVRRRLRDQEVLDDAGRIVVPLVGRWVRESVSPPGSSR